MKECGIITGDDLLKCPPPERMTELYGLDWTSRDLQVPDKVGSLQQAAPAGIHAGPEYLQRRKFRHLSGQPVPFLITLRAQEFFTSCSYRTACVSEGEAPRGNALDSLFHDSSLSNVTCDLSCQQTPGESGMLTLRKHGVWSRVESHGQIP